MTGKFVGVVFAESDCFRGPVRFVVRMVFVGLIRVGFHHERIDAHVPGEYLSL